MAQDTCTIDGCEKRRRGRLYCSMHYERVRLTGDPGPAGSMIPSYDPSCAVDGCDRASSVRGYCQAHYTRILRTGSAGAPDVAVKYETPEEAFTARTRREGGCLVWTGHRTRKGYGTLLVGRKYKAAHRYAWEREHGPIPEGKVIDHTCWNRACVDVEHLRLATLSENARHLRGARSNNRSTGVRGVYPSGDRFEARVTIAGVQKCLGTFPTIEEATRVAEAARDDHYGAFAGGS